jgi:hypothetical protein
LQIVLIGSFASRAASGLPAQPAADRADAAAPLAADSDPASRRARDFETGLLWQVTDRATAFDLVGQPQLSGQIVGEQAAFTKLPPRRAEIAGAATKVHAAHFTRDEMEDRLPSCETWQKPGGGLANLLAGRAGR